MTNIVIDMLGKKYGRYTVIARAKRPNYASEKRAYWRCLCECGEERILAGKSLRNGNSKSCGCAVTEKLVAFNTTHGMCHRKEYKIWENMKTRCTNPKNEMYRYYGGRGIFVCDSWKHSFAEFYKDMGKCPPGMSIDRIDNNGDYKPENCRWADTETQRNNRSNNNLITYQDKTLSIAQWSRNIGISSGTLRGRIKTSKWPIEKALTTPIMSYAESSRIGLQKRWGCTI